ncbi:DUF3604 domain-containing protein [Rubritalea tangerina]|uniref:DUF3604 domain-containing protein n=1 Tax=Rubritalea tangerina TaxID=430798 RepID=A0ABW4ZAZ5_9BACT
MKRISRYTVVSMVGLSSAFAETETKSSVKFSPYVGETYPQNVYWGDTHLHTRLSLDAGMFGNTLGVDEAYRFAKGEEITSATGIAVRLARPLDWLVVTDHTDLMGFAPDFQAGEEHILADKKGKEWYEGYKKGGEAAATAAFDLITNFSQETLPPALLKAYSPGSKEFAAVWKEIVDGAEAHNDPGKFTAFIGFEWTSVPKGFNLHRNVILRDNGDKAMQVVPPTTQKPMGSTDPLHLYKWLEEYEKKTGGKALSLAHNGNLSNGWMFPTEDTYSGGKVDENYVKLRAKWEPQYEITQIKGDGESHPYLSPDDPFADYENWDVGNLDLTQLKKPEMLKGEYAREALKQGLLLERKLGTNPYKFGFGGATDSHTSLATGDEDNFFGKSASAEPSKTRVSHPFVESKLGKFAGHTLVASGYTGIWAEENTREALFDALVRKETYGTTGPRMKVRFFGGWDFTEKDLFSPQAARAGYMRGVPMGGDLKAGSGKAPTFMISAVRDAQSANLDRVQVIKGWLDKDDKLHEKVYDVAVSDGRKIENGSCKTPVGNTVDVETATWQNTIGAPELGAVWSDPDFDATEPAFYYVRVLEIPTPRWVLYDKVRLGAELPKEAKLVDQERAYTSPIWYNPK